MPLGTSTRLPSTPDLILSEITPRSAGSGRDGDSRFQGQCEDFLTWYHAGFFKDQFKTFLSSLFLDEEIIESFPLYFCIFFPINVGGCFSNKKEINNLKSYVALPLWLSWLEHCPYTRRLQVRSLVRACMGGSRSMSLHLSNQ